MNLPCLGGCARGLHVPDEHRDQIIALIGTRHEDPDRFDGLRVHGGWILAFIHEFAGGVLVAVCPDCRPRMLPTYAQDGPEFPAFIPKAVPV